MIKAQKLKDFDPSKFQPGHISIKYNGIHAIYDPEIGLYSRTPRRLVGLSHIEDFLKEHWRFSRGTRLVGELIVPGKPFQEASGLIRNLSPVPNAVYMVFNSFNLSLTHPFYDRWPLLEKYLVTNDSVKLVKYVGVNSLEALYKIFETQVNTFKREGICWISPFHIYAPGKRNWDWMRLVPEKTCEAEVLDILPGTPGKKYAGSTGALLCKLPTGQKFRVGIFKGFDDTWRKRIFENKDKHIGKQAKIQYKDLSAKGVPIQPRFLEWRWDLEAS